MPEILVSPFTVRVLLASVVPIPTFPDTVVVYEFVLYHCDVKLLLIYIFDDRFKDPKTSNLYCGFSIPNPILDLFITKSGEE